MRRAGTLALLALCAVTAACDKRKNVEPPMELVRFEERLSVTRAWSASARGGDETLRLGLAPAVESGRVYVAGHRGSLQALELETGRTVWRTDTDLPLGGGPAIGGGLVAAGGIGGGVVALDAATGAERWRAFIGGEVLTAPAVEDSHVVVRTVDGRLIGLRAADGVEAWGYEQPVPRLTLRGSGRPLVVGDVVLAGFDNGKVSALSLGAGDLLWSATVAPSRGRTEIERLVDIDSPLTVIGQDVYVAGYQGRVAMLALESGQIWWGRDLSSHRGLTSDGERLYVTAADSTVVALRRRDGTELWRQSQLLRRSLTAPAVTPDGLVVADFEGYLHWLDPDSGEILGRASAGGRVSNTPVAAGGLVLVQTDAGEVRAFRVSPRRAR